MDKLEKTKVENSDNPEIVSDEHGKAACVKFAQEIFDLAEKAVDANKVGRQTSDKFQAAATFFELANIWGAPDAETRAKIKYAKYNAGRIYKAIREGRDPNESNPRRKESEKIPENEDSGLPALDPNDPDVRILMGTGAGGRHSPAALSVPPAATPTRRFLPPMPQPVTVEDVSDQGEAVPVPNSSGISPTESSALSLPSAPSALDQISPLAPPGQIPRSHLPGVDDSEPPPHPPKLAPKPASINDFYGTTPSQPTPLEFTNAAPSVPALASAPAAPQYPPPVQTSTLNHGVATHDIRQQSQALPPYAPSIPQASGNAEPPQQQEVSTHAQRYTRSDAKMAEAQRHAKWAISALNFEDVATAVKELRIALDQLLE